MFITEVCRSLGCLPALTSNVAALLCCDCCRHQMKMCDLECENDRNLRVPVARDCRLCFQGWKARLDVRLSVPFQKKKKKQTNKTDRMRGKGHCSHSIVTGVWISVSLWKNDMFGCYKKKKEGLIHSDLWEKRSYLWKLNFIRGKISSGPNVVRPMEETVKLEEKKPLFVVTRESAHYENRV